MQTVLNSTHVALMRKNSKQGMHTTLKDHSLGLIHFNELTHHRLEERCIGLIVYAILEWNVHGIVLAPAINQSISQSTNQSANQPPNQPTNQSVTWSVFNFCLLGSSGELTDDEQDLWRDQNETCNHVYSWVTPHMYIVLFIWLLFPTFICAWMQCIWDPVLWKVRCDNSLVYEVWNCCNNSFVHLKKVASHGQIYTILSSSLYKGWLGRAADQQSYKLMRHVCNMSIVVTLNKDHTSAAL